MVDFGLIAPTSHFQASIRECLRFFDLSQIDEGRRSYVETLEGAAFRTSPTYSSNLAAVAAWIRQGEIEADAIDCNSWSAERFRETLSTLRSLTKRKDPAQFVPDLQDSCARRGVAVVVIPAPSGCTASGATRFLSPRKAVLILSVRYLSDDHFWFTFFHVSGHLLLHGEERLIIEDPEITSATLEGEANDLATQLLVPLEYRNQFLGLTANSRDVIRFALRVGVAPGIIVGQLQHCGILGRDQLNRLKRRYRWVVQEGSPTLEKA